MSTAPAGDSNGVTGKTPVATAAEVAEQPFDPVTTTEKLPAFVAV